MANKSIVGTRRAQGLLVTARHKLPGATRQARTKKRSEGGHRWAIAWLVALALAGGKVLIQGPPAMASEPVVLKAGTPVRTALDLEQGELAQFVIDVPADAVLLRVEITGSPLPLDILARWAEPIESPKDAEHASEPDTFPPRLLISRQTEPPLEEGTWYLAVGYLKSSVAVVRKRPARKIPFTLEASLVRAKPEGVLQPPAKVSGHVQAEEGSLKIYAIDVPPQARVLRLDLDGTHSDLDLLARAGQPAVRSDDAEETAISPLGRESLVLGADPQRPLSPGRWYVSVVHPVDYGTADFTLYATLGPDPPAAVLAIPPVPRPADPRGLAVYATVEVATELGAASGTLVREDGLVLTSYHCVADVAENPPEPNPVIVAVTLDPRRPPVELFRGRVAAFDKKLDLALVRITSGLYGQPLPAGYHFPVMPLGDPQSLQIGDPVVTLGFPGVGGSAGRVSVTLTRGVLSGFERTPIGTLLKTDAAISPGNSGGAALDQAWRLIGVPTYENVDPQFVGRMSYIHPVSLLPAPWRAMIAGKETR